MPLLDAMYRALIDRETGQVSPIRLAQVIGGVASHAEIFSNERMQQILTSLITPWAVGVAKQAPNKWMLPANVAPSCAFEMGARTCGTFAVGACQACGRPICLNHALVAGDATLVCWVCMREVAKHVKPWRPPPSASPDDNKNRHFAYSLLGLQPGCSEEEAKKAYKRRVAKFHPDRVGGGEDSKENGDLVRTLKEAYDAVVADIEARK